MFWWISDLNRVMDELGVKEVRKVFDGSLWSCKGERKRLVLMPPLFQGKQ